jgi:hypothetical protein
MGMYKFIEVICLLFLYVFVCSIHFRILHTSSLSVCRKLMVGNISNKDTAIVNEIFYI